MEKVVNLDLEYELDPDKGEKRTAPENPTISRNIIENAIGLVHPTMKGKMGRLYRTIIKKMEKVLAANKVFVIFDETEFNFLDECVDNADYPHQQAFIVPILQDELDRAKNRSQKESKQILDTIEHSDKASEQVNKVLEMSKANKS